MLVVLQNGGLPLSTRIVVAAVIFSAFSAPALSQQMFKCMVGGKPTFQQMPCSPTNVGERMPLKSLPGTGEGLRSGEVGLIVEKEQQEAREQAKREAEAKAWEEDYERRQASRMSREDEAKINNLNSDLHRRDMTRSQRDAINAELDRLYSKNGVQLPPRTIVQEPERPKPTFGSKTINTPKGIVHCNVMTIGNNTTEQCY